MRHQDLRSIKFLLAFCLLLIQLLGAQSAAQAATFGEFDEVSGRLITFKLNRNNIPGSDFYAILPGFCLYDDGEINENTFSMGRGDFPDLLLQGKRIQAEFEATSDTGHVGTFSIDCRARKNRTTGKIKSFRCEVNFYSPAQPEIQLDYCSGGGTFTMIRKFKAN